MLAPEVIQNAEKRVGETIGGKWHLDRVIGVGGMAAVYEATHRNRNRVAIKMLHPALSLEEGTKHRFLREGYVANTIRHAGAVQVLDDDVTEDGHAFLVMELLHGESVDERMHRKGGALEMQEALTVSEQLLDVLEAAHDQGVIHRDVKPDNLFLTDEGKLKVLDFGIARLTQGNSKATKVGSFMGTPAFCAQEQARGRWDEVDHRTDLYSVGATLFTMLTGLHVHEAETSSEQLALAIGATARSLGEVMPNAPRELVELVDTALAYDKEDRFQSARAMRAAVQRVKAGLPVSRKLSTPAPPPSGARTFGPMDLDPDSVRPVEAALPPKTRRVLFGGAAALAVALVLFFTTRPPDAESPSAEPPSGEGEGSEAREGSPKGSAPRAQPSPTDSDGGDIDRATQKDGAPTLAVTGDTGSGGLLKSSLPPRTDSETRTPRDAVTASSPQPKAPATASGTPKVLPTPAPEPAPAAAPSTKDDMFNRRF